MTQVVAQADAYRKIRLLFASLTPFARFTGSSGLGRLRLLAAFGVAPAARGHPACGAASRSLSRCPRAWGPRGCAPHQTTGNNSLRSQLLPSAGGSPGGGAPHPAQLAELAYGRGGSPLSIARHDTVAEPRGAIRTMVLYCVIYICWCFSNVLV